MKRIWNTFCEDISKNKNVKEKIFEKDIVKGFLQALGWSRYADNLVEQYGLYSRKWIPDFICYLNNDKNAEEVILELKKPGHKQSKSDIAQIEAYMKLTDCRFGLYFGEKLEVFYLQEKDNKRSAVSVTNIDWTIDNVAGINLIELLDFKHYDRKKLERFCMEHLYLNSFLNLWKTQRGQMHLYEGIMEHFTIPPTMASSLQSRLKFSIVECSDEKEEQNTLQQDIDTLDSDVITHQDNQPRFSTLATLPNYLNYLRSDLTKEVMNYIGMNTDISLITNLENLELLKEEIKKIEKKRGIHHTHSCALSRYIEYIKAGLTFKDMEFDANLVRKNKSRKKSEVKSKKTRNPIFGVTKRSSFEFSMVSLSKGDKIRFEPTQTDVIVHDNKKIIYNGKVHTLTGFCKEYLPQNMRNNSGAYQGPKFFSYQGKTLWELRLEKEKSQT